jgi:DNA-binding MarR family transcriptional regulator
MATTSRDDARTLEAHAAIEKLTRLTDLFLERREQLASRAGLTDGQWQVLEEISTERFMPSMFARDRDSSRASVSKVLRQLLDRGLARVAVSPKDGRQRTYALTPAGKGRPVGPAGRAREGHRGHLAAARPPGTPALQHVRRRPDRPHRALRPSRRGVSHGKDPL